MNADQSYEEANRTSFYDHGVEAIAEVLTRLKELRKPIGGDHVFLENVTVTLAYDASDAFVEIWWDNEAEAWRVRPIFEAAR